VLTSVRMNLNCRAAFKSAHSRVELNLMVKGNDKSHQITVALQTNVSPICSKLGNFNHVSNVCLEENSRRKMLYAASRTLRHSIR
jgi:hypothetical protein